jgi:hypothetical protein
MIDLQESRDNFRPTKESIDRLRKQTGMGFYQCKEALHACLGDEVECVKYLRLLGTTRFTDYYRDLNNRLRNMLRKPAPPVNKLVRSPTEEEISDYNDMLKMTAEKTYSENIDRKY